MTAESEVFPTRHEASGDTPTVIDVCGFSHAFLIFELPKLDLRCIIPVNLDGITVKFDCPLRPVVLIGLLHDLFLSCIASKFVGCGGHNTRSIF